MDFNLVVLNMSCEKLKYKGCQKRKELLKRTKKETKTNKLKRREQLIILGLKQICNVLGLFKQLNHCHLPKAKHNIQIVISDIFSNKRTKQVNWEMTNVDSWGRVQGRVSVGYFINKERIIKGMNAKNLLHFEQQRGELSFEEIISVPLLIAVLSSTIPIIQHKNRGIFQKQGARIYNDACYL